MFGRCPKCGGQLADRDDEGLTKCFQCGYVPGVTLSAPVISECEYCGVVLRVSDVVYRIAGSTKYFCYDCGKAELAALRFLRFQQVDAGCFSARKYEIVGD